jgi:hypothetical protein
VPVYDTGRYDPAAPVALVAIRNSLTAAIVSGVPMLLDTGADVTLLPQTIVEQLGIAIDSNSGYQ